MRGVFIGPVLYWVVLGVILCGLYLMGVNYLHSRAFNLFSAVMVALVALGYAVLLVTYRRGMRITRDPLEED